MVGHGTREHERLRIYFFDVEILFPCDLELAVVLSAGFCKTDVNETRNMVRENVLEEKTPESLA